jgi:hypothetical protein
MGTTPLDVRQERSPRYPRYPLEVAIQYADRLYKGAHRSTVDTMTAYKVMGFAGKSGASATALGAARQFGLVEAVKGGVRVSGLALAILEPSSAEERIASLHVAANKPDVFEAVMDHFEGAPPRSDEPIRAFLIRSKGFSRVGADEFLNSFRATFAFLEEVGDSGHPVDDPQVPAATEQEIERTAVERPPAARTDVRTEGEVIRLRLSRDCVAELAFEGPVSNDALDRLVRHIDLMREIWAE